MSRVVPPFNPRIPTTDPEAQEFGRNTTDFLNQPIRNEVTYGIEVPAAPADLGLWSPTYTVTVRRAGFSPFRDGFVLRRVRLVKTTASSKSGSSSFPGVVVTAKIQTDDRETAVGDFSTYDYAMRPGRSRNMSGVKDIAKPIPAGSVLIVEAVYSVVPPITFTDATVLFDLGVT